MLALSLFFLGFILNSSTLPINEFFLLCRYNGALPSGDRGRRKSRFALYKRPKANGVKPSTVHVINTPQASKVGALGRAGGQGFGQLRCPLALFSSTSLPFPPEGWAFVIVKGCSVPVALVPWCQSCLIPPFSWHLPCDTANCLSAGFAHCLLGWGRDTSAL